MHESNVLRPPMVNRSVGHNIGEERTAMALLRQAFQPAAGATPMGPPPPPPQSVASPSGPTQPYEKLIDLSATTLPSAIDSRISPLGRPSQGRPEYLISSLPQTSTNLFNISPGGPPQLSPFSFHSGIAAGPQTFSQAQASADATNVTTQGSKTQLHLSAAAASTPDGGEDTRGTPAHEDSQEQIDDVKQSMEEEQGILLGEDISKSAAARPRRSSALVDEPQVTPSKPTNTQRAKPVQRGRRRGRPHTVTITRGSSKRRPFPGRKPQMRQRSEGEESDGGSPKPDEAEEVEDESSSEDYSQAHYNTRTKSGRTVQRPAQYTGEKITYGSGSRLASALGTPVQSSTARRLASPSEIQFCSICSRGNSPPGNRIVYCGFCETPYHQLCHEPVIDEIFINLTDAEWYCKKCIVKRASLPLETGATGSGLTQLQVNASFFLMIRSVGI